LPHFYTAKLDLTESLASFCAFLSSNSNFVVPLLKIKMATFSTVNQTKNSHVKMNKKSFEDVFVIKFLQIRSSWCKKHSQSLTAGWILVLCPLKPWH